MNRGPFCSPPSGGFRISSCVIAAVTFIAVGVLAGSVLHFGCGVGWAKAALWATPIGALEALLFGGPKRQEFARMGFARCVVRFSTAYILLYTLTLAVFHLGGMAMEHAWLWSFPTAAIWTFGLLSTEL